MSTCDEGCPILQQIYAWHCIVLYPPNNKLTIQYNRERSNTIECNTMPCINLLNIGQYCPHQELIHKQLFKIIFFNSVLYTPKFLINLMICRVNNVLHDVQCNAAFLCCITEINVGYFATGNIQV